MRALIAIFLLAFPTTIRAACNGEDLRPGLNSTQRVEIAQRLADVPYSSGNYWTATREDRVVHVIGTMHIDHPALDDIAARLAPVIKAADHVFVEATKEDQIALQRAISTNPELAFLSGPTLIDLLPSEEWARLAEAAKARGLPPFMAAKFQPWYLSLMLSMPPCVLEGLANGEHGLDHRIMDLAAKAEVPLSGLERFDTVFTLFNQGTLDEQLEMLRLGMLSVKAAEDATATLMNQYLEQNHMEAMETSRIASRLHLDVPADEFDAMFDDLMTLMIGRRNQGWMPVIDAAEGDSIVAAAGALHLGGDRGVLNLLAQEGYVLERQPF